MNTTENNKNIAEFMGHHLEHPLIDTYEPNGEDFKYDTSWDWLMEVIKKIKTEAFQNLSLEAYREHKLIWRMVENPADYEIGKVFEQVAEFIKRKN